MKKQYIALRRLGEQGGGRQWQPGEIVELDDDRAAVLLKRGYISLAEPEPLLLPTEPSAKRKRKAKDEMKPEPVIEPALEDEHALDTN